MILAAQQLCLNRRKTSSISIIVQIILSGPGYMDTCKDVFSTPFRSRSPCMVGYLSLIYPMYSQLFFITAGGHVSYIGYIKRIVKMFVGRCLYYTVAIV